MEFLEYLGYAELASKGVISDWILAGAGMHGREMQSFGGGGGAGRREIHGQASLEDPREYCSPFLYCIQLYYIIVVIIELLWEGLLS